MGSFLPPAERRSGALLGLYAAFSLILLVVGDRLPQGWLRSIGAHLFAPVDRVVLTGDRLGAAWRESRQLHRRITELELQMARFRQAGVENERLRDSLQLPTLHAYSLHAVEVLSLSGTPVPVAATLSAGRNRGFEVGDIVMTSDGLLGRIGECYANLSRVILLSDPSSVVACEVESTGVLGMLRATTAPVPRLLLTGVPLSDTVRVGQRVLTSGLSLRYSRHLPVGRVARVDVGRSGLTQDVEIDPGAHYSTLRHAFILKGSGARARARIESALPGSGDSR
jgi:rod shape-determining protein MreC